MIEKSFEPSVKLFFKAHRAVVNRTWPVKIMVMMSLVLPLIAIAITALTNTRLSPAIWGGASGLFIYTFIVLPLFQFISIKRSIASNPSANQLQKYELTERGIRNFGDGVDVSIDWGKVVRVEMTSAFLLFYVSSSAAYFIPGELMAPAELDLISQWHKDYCS
ncbi:YcxB family protein [Stutzerimonas stutzeri]|uniref:YcxB family protein n=1 Tax=Stutzerimonas stutzeri TaxID=316 RepID=UPI00210D838F|nr:YcxB family protein [Stutzerimonas stutzeri]MCQ4260018.1 YcxB family protein [Stutzerimonas stutzeri]